MVQPNLNPIMAAQEYREALLEAEATLRAELMEFQNKYRLEWASRIEPAIQSFCSVRDDAQAFIDAKVQLWEECIDEQGHEFRYSEGSACLRSDIERWSIDLPEIALEMPELISPENLDQDLPSDVMSILINSYE